jgi:bacterioferritin
MPPRHALRRCHEDPQPQLIRNDFPSHLQPRKSSAREHIDDYIYQVSCRSSWACGPNFQKNISIRCRRKIMDDATTGTAIDALNKIMELELAGVVKYTHYSLMVYGYNRIPIVSWLKGNADESLVHAHKAGELVTLMGGHPSLKIGTLLETAQHDIGDILRESLEHEKTALTAYYDLLKIAEGQSVLLEEYAREMIVAEELHLDEVNKMLRRPGSIDSFKP